MKINRKDLFRALKLAARVAPGKTPKPILQNVLLAADGDTLTVTATDLELYSKTELKVGCAGEWMRLVNAKAARDLVKELPEGDVELEPLDPINLKIGGATLVGDLPETYPSMLEMRGELVHFNKPAADFKRMVDSVMFAASREESRYMINGVLMEVKGEKLRLVATDGRRLAKSECAAGTDDGPINAIIPLDTLKVLRVSMGKKDMLHMDVADEWMRFSWGDSTLTTMLLEGKFPDYETVIPKSADVVVDVERKPLEAALKRLKTSTSDDCPIIHFEANGNLHLSAEATGKGQDSVELSAKVSGSGDIAFNPDYVLQALKVADVDMVQLRFTDGDTPAIFDLGYLYVLMPIRGV